MNAKQLVATARALRDLERVLVTKTSIKEAFRFLYERTKCRRAAAAAAAGCAPHRQGVARIP